MLHDLPCGRLENEFRNVEPTANASVVCFQDNKALVKRDKNDVLTLPTYAQVMEWAQAEHWEHWNEAPVQYVFRLHDVDYFIWMGAGKEASDTAFQYEVVRDLRQLVSKLVCFAITTAWHL